MVTHNNRPWTQLFQKISRFATGKYEYAIDNNEIF